MDSRTKLYLIMEYEDTFFNLEDMEIYDLVKQSKLPKEILLFVRNRTSKMLKHIEDIIRDESGECYRNK